jgi:hypothetical protein
MNRFSPLPRPLVEELALISLALLEFLSESYSIHPSRLGRSTKRTQIFWQNSVNIYAADIGVYTTVECDFAPEK